MLKVVIEKFDSSIPEWVRKAVATDGYKLKNYSLDNLEFQNIEPRYITSMSDVAKMWSIGHTPVFELDFSGKPLYITVPNRTRGTSSREFKSALSDALPWNLRKLKYSDILDHLVNFGYIKNGRENTIAVNKKKQDRSEAKWHIPKPKDPESYQNGLKKDRYALRASKELNSIYDELNSMFDQAMDKIANADTQSANAIYRDMKYLEDQYNNCIKAIDRVLSSSADSYYKSDWYDDEENGYLAKDYRAQEMTKALSDLKANIEEAKLKYDIV